MTKRSWVLTLGAIALLAIGTLLLWPTSDPLANVQTVALQLPGQQGQPATATGSKQPPLARGLEVALGERHIRIITDPEAADALISIEFDQANIRLDKNGIQATARCIITKKNGQRGVLLLTLTVDQQGIHARLVQPKSWQFWR